MSKLFEFTVHIIFINVSVVKNKFMLSSIHHESVYISAPLRNRASLPRDQLNSQLSSTPCLSLTPLAAPATKTHTAGSINIYSFYIHLYLCMSVHIYPVKYTILLYSSVWVHEKNSLIHIYPIYISISPCNQISPCIRIPTGHRLRPGSA